MTHVAGALEITRSAPFDAGTLAVAMGGLERFERAWDIAFFFFSTHLILLDYLADSTIGLAMNKAPFVFAPFTFVGEMALMIWLLAVAARPGVAGDDRQHSARSAVRP